MAKELLPTPNRRTVLRKGLLVGLGAGVVAIASPALTGRARAAITPQQGSWAWCNYCQGMFYGPQVNQSYCPGNTGGPHNGNDNSYEYSLYYDAPVGSPINQGNWN
jgi:hypothetical protein